MMAALDVLVAGCSESEPPARAIVVALESWPQNLDPRFATDASSSRIGDLVFRALTRAGTDQRHVPDLALEWRLESPRAVVFHLRRDAVFHDGTPVRAGDVRAVYESILDPATASPKRGSVAFLEAVEAPDPYTVRFRMKEPYAPYLEASTIGIVPATMVGKGGPVTIGSGPFRVSESRAGDEVRLRAVSANQGLEEIRFRVIPDDTVRTLEVRRGTVQLVENAIEPDNLEWLASHTDRCIERTRGTTFQYLGFNLRRPPLDHIRVRRAIALAIDRESIIAGLLGGTARAATGLLSPEHWAYEPSVRTYAHDPAQARRLLDEAGYPDPDGSGPAVRFRLSYKTTVLDSRRRIAEAVQANLADVGVGVDVQSYEWGTFYGDVRRGNFEMYSLAWVGVTDPDIYFDLMHSSRMPPAGNNRGGYDSAEIDVLTERGRRTLEPADRREIYSAVQRIAADELPMIPLWWSDVVAVRDPRLCGFTPAPDGRLDSLRFAWWSSPASSPGCECPR
ncbi:MAG: peptide/nickel transport system substrate-binding protein [Candidatus Binatota bacterium]|nr:peptide/nickel transport system substrate-binding protein [Candidatus Binatota bacterium]